MNKFKVDPYYVTVYVTTVQDEFKRLYKKFNGGHLNQGTDYAGLCSDFGSIQLIGVFQGGLDTLAHEATHCVLNICESRGIKPLADQEPTAFMFGKLIGDIYAKMADIRGQDSHK